MAEKYFGNTPVRLDQEYAFFWCVLEAEFPWSFSRRLLRSLFTFFFVIRFLCFETTCRVICKLAGLTIEHFGVILLPIEHFGVILLPVNIFGVILLQVTGFDLLPAKKVKCCLTPGVFSFSIFNLCFGGRLTEVSHIIINLNLAFWCLVIRHLFYLLLKGSQICHSVPFVLS